MRLILVFPSFGYGTIIRLLIVCFPLFVIHKCLLFWDFENPPLFKPAYKKLVILNWRTECGSSVSSIYFEVVE